jgi:ACS family sodium-dependent inorganic phosphate cotransporter
MGPRIVRLCMPSSPCSPHLPCHPSTTHSAFNIGYMVTNLYGGTLAASHSPKRALTAGVLLWSTFTLLTPVAAASGSLHLLLLVRAAMGLGEGIFFPTVQVLVKGWVPHDSRSKALGLIYSGHQIGSIVSLLASPAVISDMGWEWVFYLYGALGFLWVVFFLPQGAPGGVEEGYSYTAHKVACVTGSPSSSGGHIDKGLWHLPWRAFLTNRVFWALVLAHSTFGIGYNLCIAWLPTYYSQEYDLQVRESAWMSVLPWAVMALTTNAAGWAADHIISRQLLSTTRTRKLLQTLGTAGPAVCLGYLALTSSGEGSGRSLTEAMLLLTGMMGFQGLQAGGFAATHQDIASKYAGVIFGITNAIASLSSSVSLALTGLALELTQSWALVFQCVAACNVLCCSVFLLFASSEPQFD